MPAIAQYPTAWSQMHDLAAAAREAAVPFADFWEAAMRPGRPPITWRVPEEKRPADAVVWPNDTQTRKDDQAAMNATRAGWARAYAGMSQLPREAALDRLLSLFDRARTALELEEDFSGTPVDPARLEAERDGMLSGEALPSAA